jgi:CRP-like cAMP-binding protein
MSTLTGSTKLTGMQSAAIRAVRPFRLVVDEDIEQLDREIAMVDAAAGSTLFEEGDAADGVASIVEGNVEILKRGRVLAILGPGTVVGELSIFVSSASRNATARASTSVRMIKWSAEDLQDRLARHERLATAIVADIAFVLAERLGRTTDDLLSVLDAAGTRLPVSDLERFRSRAVQ